MVHLTRPVKSCYMIHCKCDNVANREQLNGPEVLDDMDEAAKLEYFKFCFCRAQELYYAHVHGV